MTASGGIASPALAVILTVLCAGGVISNVLVLIIVFMTQVTGVTESFICNLAVNDLLLAGVAIPIQLAQGLSSGHGFTGGR